MKKKAISLAVCIMLAVQLFAGMGMKADASGTFDPWYGYTVIRTKADLNAIRNNLNGKYYLENDIVFSASDFAAGGAFYNGGNGWLAIGSEANPFTGIFDGCNYTIGGLKMTPSNAQNITGLFAVNNGTIERVALNAEVNANITLTANAEHKPYAILTGINGYNGIIRNCSASGSFLYEISNAPSSFYATIFIGAIASKNNGNITRCSNAANFTLKTPISDSNHIYSMSAGGICGQNIGTVAHSYNIGNISKNKASVLETIVYDSIGGIVGNNSKNIQYCYNTGLIQNSGYSSAIADYYRESLPQTEKVQDCYFLDNMTTGSRSANANTNAKLIKKTSAQMKQKATYADWDFNYVWDIAEGTGFPTLRKDLYNLDSGHMAFSAGNGSTSDPFVIENKSQFLNISRYLDRCFLLANDINLQPSDFQRGGLYFEWDGLGFEFTGTLDGGNNTISGFTVWPDLFASNRGTICNLNLTLANATASLTSSFNAATIGGIVSNNQGNILNCSISGNAAFADTGVFTDRYTIGAIACTNSGEIKNCISKLNITAPFTKTGTIVIGGISGTNGGTISASSNHGDIIVTGYDNINLGGITGVNTDQAGRIEKCFNDGDLAAMCDGWANSSGWVRAGGIAAVNEAQEVSAQKTYIENCFNIGNITAMNLNDESTLQIKVCAGGILAFNGAYGSVKYCYNAGAVEAYAQGLVEPSVICGGAVGKNSGSVSSSVSLDLDISGIGDGNSAGVLLKTMEQMKSVSGFAGFDFTNVWEFKSGIDYQYPILKNTAFSFVRKPVGIKTITPPAKTTYREDESFNFSGLKVDVLYNNGFAELADKVEVIWDEVYYGINQFYILYSDDEYHYFRPLEITVNPKPFNKISMVTLPDYTMYFKDSYLDLEGATIKINYTDGTSKNIDVTDDMVTVSQLTNVGTINITVTFFGKTTSFNISVFNPYLTSTQYAINRSKECISGIRENTSVSSLLKGITPKELSYIVKNSNLLTDSSVVGTGCILAMTDGNDVLDAVYTVVTGDLNGDGKITLTDYAKLKAHLLESEKMKGPYLLAADINGDGKATLTDYAKLKAHLLGRETISPKKY